MWHSLGLIGEGCSTVREAAEWLGVAAVIGFWLTAAGATCIWFDWTLAHPQAAVHITEHTEHAPVSLFLFLVCSPTLPLFVICCLSTYLSVFPPLTHRFTPLPFLLVSFSPFFVYAFFSPFSTHSPIFLFVFYKQLCHCSPFLKSPFVYFELIIFLKWVISWTLALPRLFEKKEPFITIEQGYSSCRAYIIQRMASARVQL